MLLDPQLLRGERCRTSQLRDDARFWRFLYDYLCYLQLEQDAIEFCDQLFPRLHLRRD